MTFTRLWAFLAIGLPVLAAVIAPFPSVDLTYHLRAGGEILDTRAIPRVDTWTFTVAGQPWLDQQWLPQVILAAVYRVAGWTGLVVLRAGLVGVAFALLFDLCRRRAGSTRIAAWLTIAAFVVAAVTLGLRPQLFGVALFAGVLWLVTRRAEIGSWLWIAPVLVGAWANIHGSFVLGPVVVGIALVEDVATRSAAARRTGTLLAACLAATLANPFLLDVWTYAARISTNTVITKRITEWLPTSPLTAEGAAFYVSVVATIAVVVMSWCRGRSPWRSLLWIVPFGILGAWAVRGLAWWPFVAATAVARLLDRRPTTPNAARAEPVIIRRLNVAIVAAIGVVAVVALPEWRPLDPGLGAPMLVVGAAPSGITGALRQIVKPGDRILAPQPWGSWFEFAFPETTVAVDSRIELFPNAVWQATDDINAGLPNATQRVDDWGVTFVVATPADMALVDRLRLAGWTVIADDEDGVLLGRAAAGIQSP